MIDDKDLVLMATKMATKEDIVEMKNDINGLCEMTQFHENISTSSQIGRHEKWLHILADKIGLKLEY